MLKKLRNMKVEKRLKQSFMYVVMITGFAAVLAVIMMLVIDNRYGNALVDNGFIQGDIGEYSAYLNKSSALARDVITLTSSSDVSEAEKELKEADEKVDFYLKEFTAKLESDEEQKLLDDINENYPKYIKARDEAISMAKSGDHEGALAKFRKDARPYLLKAMEDSESLLELNVKMGDEKSSNLTLFTIGLVVVVVIVIVVAVLLSTRLAVATAKDFAKPVEKVEAAIQKLSNGELDVDISDDSKNEFGSMARHLNKAVAMIKTYVDTIEFGLEEVAKGNFAVQPPIEFHGDFVALKNSIIKITTELSVTMRLINEGADQTAIGAEQMADSAQSLAEGATSQAGAAQELTATIENVAGVAEESAKQADMASVGAAELAKVAEESGREMELLVEAMQKITETSQQIESIIVEIENIAAQTNLLSLNASIEAARAGEAGRGFAVVADQIGKLAADSKESAVNTRELIGKSLDEINKGDEIAAKTSEALQQVLEGINQIAGEAKANSETSAEQARTMAEVLDGIEQITEVIQTNSAAAEETSATSEELAAQSQNLKALIERFILLEE